MTAQLVLKARVGGYRAQEMVADRLARLLSDVARLVGADAAEVAVVENASRGWTLAVQAAATGWESGERVLVSRAEFGSCRIALDRLAAAAGVDVQVIPDEGDGRLSVAALTSLLDERVRLVALTLTSPPMSTRSTP